MFQEGAFNVLSFYPPAQGMNRNVSPESLSQEYAYHLENLLPRPRGKLTLRYGNRKLPRIDPDNVYPLDAEIIEKFPFQKSANQKQLLLYARVFVDDITLSDATLITSSQFSFKTDAPDKYQSGERLKIRYIKAGAQHVFKSYILSVSVTGAANEKKTVTINLAENTFPSDIETLTLDKIYYPSGSLYLQDLTTTQISLLKESLSISCVPRCETYLQTLLICNGVDEVQRWDGTTLSPLRDYVKDTSLSEFKTNTNNPNNLFFKSDLTLVQLTTRYLNTPLRVILNGITTSHTVTAVGSSTTPGRYYLTLTPLPLTIVSSNRVEVFYNAPLPTFSFIKVAHDRLWALGPGAVSLDYRAPQEALRVYFSFRAGSLTDWFNENTGTVPSIDLSPKFSAPDNLEAITLVGSFLAFVGRKETQVYQGLDPVGRNVPNALSWHMTLPVGIYHGNLLLELPNDTYFISEAGLLSFGTLNVASQFAVAATDVMDPLIREYIASISSDRAYRACRSFIYPTGPFCGFKIGLNKVMVSLYSTTPYAWSLFSGDFLQASSFLSTLDNSLYLSIDNDVYRYGDGGIDQPFYADRDGYQLINFVWITPNVAFKGRRYANKRCEIQTDNGSSAFLNSRNSLYIGIDGDLRKSFSLNSKYSFVYKGDLLGITPLSSEASPLPNPINTPELGFRLDEPYSLYKGRLKFVSSQFWVTISGNAENGPLSFKQIKLYGTVER